MQRGWLDDLLPSDLPSPGPLVPLEASAIPDPGPRSNLHNIRVRNNCKLPFNIRLYYHGKAGWKVTNIPYYYAGGEDDYPEDGNNPLLTDSGIIFINAVDDEGDVLNGNQFVNVGGRLLGFKKYILKVSNEDYILSPCD
ncbi:MAG: hypothetical protein WDN44_05385 [Sphingomonas sp.]